jgi:rubrerythrin
VDAGHSIRHAAEFYAHALAIEREAVERYTEFAQRMTDQGNGEVAAIFARLAAFESEHVQDLQSCTGTMTLPEIPSGTYAWIDTGAPETAAHEWLFRLMTPYDALLIALHCERRAKSFFETVAATAVSPEVRLLAAGMMSEEMAHVAWVGQELAKTPKPLRPWNDAGA